MQFILVAFCIIYIILVLILQLLLIAIF